MRFGAADAARAIDRQGGFSGRLGKRRGGRSHRLLLCLICLLGLGLGLAAFAAAEPGATVSAAANPALVPPLPAWSEIVRPIELYDLEAPELAKLPTSYSARRHRPGGGREDTLAFGNLGGAGPYLRLTIYRIGTEAAPSAPFVVGLARLASAGGFAITRSAPAAVVQTRFGAAEVADVGLAPPGGSVAPCLAFQLKGAAPELRMSGFACGSVARPLSRPALACLVDRLDLNSAGDDTALAAFFARSELRRDPACAGTRLAPNPARAAWLDQASVAPPLKRQRSRR